MARHKANLAKELPPCQHKRNITFDPTQKIKTHNLTAHSYTVGRSYRLEKLYYFVNTFCWGDEGYAGNMRLSAMLADEYILICLLLSALVQARH